MGAIQDFISNFVTTGPFQIVDDNAKLHPWSKSNSRLRRSKSAPLYSRRRLCRWGETARKHTTDATVPPQIVPCPNPPTLPSKDKRVQPVTNQPLSAKRNISSEKFFRNTSQSPSKQASAQELIHAIMRLSVKAALSLTRPDRN